MIVAGLLQVVITYSQQSGSLKTGDKAPLFTAKDDNNSTWDINNFLGKKNIVLFFYPAAMTGGCTSQACGYRDDMDDFAKYDAIVAGISGDEPENLKLFREVHNLNFPLLSDPSGEIASKYGVPAGKGGSVTREINGHKHILNRGVTAKRWTFIINKEGLISYINQEVSASNDSKNVLNFLMSLNMKNN